MIDVIFSFHSVRNCVLSMAFACSFAAIAEEGPEVALAQQTIKHRVTQVVVGGERGGAYLMRTLQHLTSDTVVVTSDMACSAQPFSITHGVLAPVTSLAKIGDMPGDCLRSPQEQAVVPGIKAFHIHYFNDVYEVLYEHKGSWMVVELLEPPPNGQLVLTDAVKRASRSL